MPSLLLPLKNQRRILKAVVLLPAVIVVFAGIWVSTTAIIENARFAHATDQILHLVVIMRNISAADKRFATHPGDDLLAGLEHAGLLTEVSGGNPSTLENPWKGSITSTATTSSTARIETIMPTRDCRRLSLFFAHNGADLGLRLMEAREERTDTIWHRFYDHTSDLATLGNQPVEVACGQFPRATLALVFQLY